MLEWSRGVDGSQVFLDDDFYIGNLGVHYPKVMKLRCQEFPYSDVL